MQLAVLFFSITKGIFAGVFIILMNPQLVGITNIGAYISKIYPKINTKKIKMAHHSL